MGQFAVSDGQRLKVFDQCVDLQRRLREGGLDPELMSVGLQALLTGVDPEELAAARGKREQPAKRNLAAERRNEITAFYRGLGFDTLEIPVPTMGGKRVSNNEFGRRAKAGQALFFRPATSLISYNRFMTAVGQMDHWTVLDEAECENIAWEPTETGYWFWAEIQDSCLRVGTSWNDLTAEHNLLCLEEYMIVWHVMRVLESIMIDCETWSWLRTRYQAVPGPSALYALMHYDEVHVGWNRSRGLSLGHRETGGRIAEKLV